MSDPSFANKPKLSLPDPTTLLKPNDNRNLSTFDIKGYFLTNKNFNV